MGYRIKFIILHLRINAMTSTTLLRQLNVLKRGGYWKHLQPEITYWRGEYEPYCEADMPQELSIGNRKDESKENRVHANRQWNNSDNEDEEHHDEDKDKDKAAADDDDDDLFV